MLNLKSHHASTEREKQLLVSKSRILISKIVTVKITNIYYSVIIEKNSEIFSER